MKDGESERIVQLYLQQRGYRATEAAFKSESRTLGLEEIAFERLADEDWSISNYILLRHPNEVQPRIFEESYRALATWVDQSLDLYRTELRGVLFPLFVHCFFELLSRNLVREARTFFEAFKDLQQERYAADVQRLTAVDPLHLKDSDIFTSFRANKFNVRMCSYSFELLMEFCLERHYLVLLRLMNQYMNIQVFTGQPQQRVGDDALVAGGASSAAGSAAVEPVYWGAMEPEVDGVPAVRSLDPVRRARAQEVQANMPTESRRLPKPKPRDEDAAVEASALRELRQRATLGPTALPSACCYTFHNAQDTLTSVSISKDATWMSAGHSESYIQVYNLKGENLKQLKSGVDLTAVNVAPDAELGQFMEDTGSPQKRLIGHSGPVYGTSFSHDNRFLLSCSEDCTARLWSLETFGNLVAYKGHTYPVWACDFSPFSFYFATASHDRTARLWSSEHITPLRIFAGHLSDVDSCKFHPNAHYLATGSSDRSVRLWDVQKGDAVRIFTGHTGAVHALAFSPDGKALASAGEDGSIMIWDLGTGKRIKKLTGHRAPVYTLNFSMDGHILASGGADNTVRLWDSKRMLGLGSGGVGAGSAPNGTPANGGAAGAAASSASDDGEASDALLTLRTKSTPVQHLQFTYRNVLLAAGAYTPPST